jgi:hypothetical protein
MVAKESCAVCTYTLELVEVRGIQRIISSSSLSLVLAHVYGNSKAGLFELLKLVTYESGNWFIQAHSRDL